MKVGSGLLMTQDTLSLDTTGIVTDGDLAPFIVQLSGNTQDSGTLSGDVETNALAIANLENNVVPEIQSAITEVGQIADSANTKVEALSAVTSALTQTVAGKQDALTAGNGIDLSGSTISVKIGDGLGFSGDTLVVSGVSSGPTEYFLNNMSQQELATLYAEISGITEGASDSANIPEILSNYKFFISTDVDGQKWSEAFFSNWEDTWDDELQEQIKALWITSLKAPKPSYACGVMRSWAQIKPNGGVNFNVDSFDAQLVNDATRDIAIQLNSAGTITNTDSLGSFSSLASFHKVWFFYSDENVQNSYNTAPMSYFYRKQVGDDLMEYFGCTINIDGTFYKGTWSTPEWGWSNELAADTWTTV